MTRRWLLLFAMCLFTLAPAALYAAAGAWQLVSDKNGIKVYRQDDANARIKTFRGVTRFPVDNPASFEALMNDYAAIPRWMHFISSGTELSRREYLDRTLRFTTELPWPLSDRDVVAHMVVEQVSAYALKIHAFNDPRAPLDPDYLRIPQLNGLLEFQFHPQAREVEVTYQIVLDPGGNVPAWAANIVLKDTPYFTLLKLRRIVVEQKYASFKGTFLTYPW